MYFGYFVMPIRGPVVNLLESESEVGKTSYGAMWENSALAAVWW